MLRSIIAIAAGFIFIAVLSFGTDIVVRATWPEMFHEGRTDNNMVLFLTLAYVATYAIAGCYIAGRLAPARPMRHALILGVLGLAFTAFVTKFAWESAPVWYHVASLALVMPFAYVGGLLAELKRNAIEATRI